jgi:hypothetical protein
MRAQLNLVVDSTLHAAQEHLQIFHNSTAGSIERSARLVGGALQVAGIAVKLQFVDIVLAPVLLFVAEVQAAAHTV